MSLDHERLNKAIKYATDQHAGQCRKGSDRPYIVHPLEVFTILNSIGADTNLMIAGLLHDTIEDTGATKEDIYERFGEDVTTLVTSHTEDKSKTWKERKETGIEELRHADIRLASLIMADKLSNLRSMKRDYDRIGEKLWERFNAPKKWQQWYFAGIIDALTPLKKNPHTKHCYDELVTIYRQLFE